MSIYNNLWNISLNSNKIHSIPEIFYNHRKNEFKLYPISEMMIYCISPELIVLTNKINYDEQNQTLILGKNYMEDVKKYNLPFLLHQVDIHLPSFYQNNHCENNEHVFYKIIQYLS